VITEYPAEDRRYDQPEYEPFWTAAALDLSLSLHAATRQQGKIRGAGPGMLRDASSRATKAFYPARTVDVRHDLLHGRWRRCSVCNCFFEIPRGGRKAGRRDTGRAGRVFGRPIALAIKTPGSGVP
jgi:hypothetical protein